VTYRRLLQYGIDQDFRWAMAVSMVSAPPSLPLFIGTTSKRKKRQPLRLFPFCFMDANSFYEQQFTAGAMTELMQYYRRIRKVNGLMITIWHNSILGRDREFAGWREVYETFLKQEVFWDM
jgi:hypothetical protein